MRLNWSISKSGLIIGAQAVMMLRFIDTQGYMLALEVVRRMLVCI